MSNVSPTNWNPKVQAVGATGPVAIIIVWIAGQLGLDMPPEVAAAFAALLLTVAGWIMPVATTDDQP